MVSYHLENPRWETTWFRAAALVGLVGLVYGGYRWRGYALEQRSRQLETRRRSPHPGIAGK
jgi:hypothetical protein